MDLDKWFSTRGKPWSKSDDKWQPDSASVQGVWGGLPHLAEALTPHRTASLQDLRPLLPDPTVFSREARNLGIFK